MNKMNKAGFRLYDDNIMDVIPGRVDMDERKVQSAMMEALLLVLGVDGFTVLANEVRESLKAEANL